MRPARSTDVDKSPDWIAHGGLEAFRFQWSPDSRWLAYARPAGDQQQRDLPVRHEGRQAAPGDERLLERHAADLRSRRQVSLLRVRSRVRSGLRHVRQHLDLREPDAARRRAAAAGRQVAARRAQRRGEPGARHRQAERRQDQRREDAKAGDRPSKPAPPPNVDIDLDGFEARAVVLPPKAGQLRRPAGGQRQAALPAPAARRLAARRRARSSTSISTSARRRRFSTTPTRFEVTFDGKKMLVDAARTSTRSSTSRRSRSSRSRWRPGDIEVPVDPRAEWRQIFMRRVPLRARLLLRPGHARRRTGTRCSERYSDAARRCGDALGRELRHRRVHRRAERVAHLSRRRRPRARAASDRSACSASTGSWPTAPTASSASSAAARGTPACARRSTSRAST